MACINAQTLPTKKNIQHIAVDTSSILQELCQAHFVMSRNPPLIKMSCL